MAATYKNQRPTSREVTRDEVLQARARMPFDNSASLSRLQHKRLHAMPRVLLNIPVERAISLLRQKIAARLPSGPHGLIRCWMQFREKAGATKDGVNYKQFVHALDTYGLSLPDTVSREFFNKMDENGNGFISITEFTEVIIGRTPSSASGITFGGKSNNVVEQNPRCAADVDVPKAIMLLKQKIISSLNSGSFGVMRMWKLFRSKCGASKEGVHYAEFKHGLSMYGLNFREEVARGVFDSIDVNRNESIQIHEFIDNFMGRWTAENNSIQAIGASEEANLMVVAAGEAKRRVRQAETLRRLRDEQQAEAQAQRERLARKFRNKPKHIPIWRRTTASARSMVRSHSTNSTNDMLKTTHSWASPIERKPPTAKRTSRPQSSYGRNTSDTDAFSIVPHRATASTNRPSSATARSSTRAIGETLRPLDAPLRTSSSKRPATASSSRASQKATTPPQLNHTHLTGTMPSATDAEDEVLMSALDEDILGIEHDMRTRRSALSHALSAKGSVRTR